MRCDVICGVLQALPAVRNEEEMRDFLLPLTGVKGKKNEVRRRNRFIS
jgi:hypothetical protein